MASASDHRAHAALQPADCLILLPQRLPAAVETSIGPAHYPPSAPSQTRSFNRACAPVTGAQTLIRFGIVIRARVSAAHRRSNAFENGISGFMRLDREYKS